MIWHSFVFFDECLERLSFRPPTPLLFPSPQIDLSTGTPEAIRRCWLVSLLLAWSVPSILVNSDTSHTLPCSPTLLLSLPSTINPLPSFSFQSLSLYLSPRLCSLFVFLASLGFFSPLLYSLLQLIVMQCSRTIEQHWLIAQSRKLLPHAQIQCIYSYLKVPGLQDSHSTQLYFTGEPWLFGKVYPYLTPIWWGVLTHMQAKDKDKHNNERINLGHLLSIISESKIWLKWNGGLKFVFAAKNRVICKNQDIAMGGCI